MNIQIRSVCIGLLILALPALAVANDCEHRLELEEVVDLAGSERLVIRAAAGELRITGVPGASEAVAHGIVCASRAEWAEASRLVIESGREARIEVDLPDIDQGFSFGNRYVSMDLEIEVPEALALDVSDSSGGIEIRGVGALDLADSSGDIVINGAQGPVSLQDSSGHIDVRDIGNGVTVVRDSSGDIEISNVRGPVLIERDSSGSMEFTDIQGDVLVERDSSGSIRAEKVTGDFVVLHDGSGGIRSRDIGGEVRVPEEG